MSNKKKKKKNNIEISKVTKESKKNAEKEGTKADHGLFLCSHAVYQPVLLEYFFHQLNADRGFCQSDNFYPKWRA